MAQQRVFVGTVVSEFNSGGDETHPVYIRFGKVVQIDQVADSAHADVSDKIGTETIGGPNNPVYIKDGVPTPTGTYDSGSDSDIILGDGTSKSISDFITENIEVIREALGVVTREKMGLVPKLPNMDES